MIAEAEHKKTDATTLQIRLVSERIPGISDDDVYVLSPIWRMRNEKEFVHLEGWNGAGSYDIHHTVAILLALANGKRTIREIAEIAVPFVNAATPEERFRKSLESVKTAVAWHSLTTEEQKGAAASTMHPYPAAALVKLSELPQFHGLPQVTYDPLAIHPRNAPVNSSNICTKLHDRVPKTLQWHVTSACYTDCRYCYLGRRSIPHMKKERLIELLHEAAEIGVMDIALAGGDVLLYPYLVEVLHLLEELRFMPVQLATKSPLSKQLADELSHCRNLFELQFSVDSTIPETADFMVKTPGFYRNVVTSIENALEAGLRVSAKAVVTPYNCLTIPRLYRDLRQMGVSTVRMATYCRSGFHHSEDLFLTPNGYEWLTREIDRLKEEFPEDFVNLQNGAPRSEAYDVETRRGMWSKRNRCSSGRSMMMICADGKVIPCEQMPEREDIFVGDLTHQSIMEVWNGEPLARLTYNMPQEKFTGTVCHDCKDRSECHSLMGLCIRDSCIAYDSPYLPSPNCPHFNLDFVRTM